MVGGLCCSIMQAVRWAAGGMPVSRGRCGTCVRAARSYLSRSCTRVPHLLKRELPHPMCPFASWPRGSKHPASMIPCTNFRQLALPHC